MVQKFIPVTRNLRLAVARPGKNNDAAELLALLPPVQRQASKTFPHAEAAVAAFQPNLNFVRSYTPDLFNAIGGLGAAGGYYDGNGHYVRASPSALNLFKDEAGTLEPIHPQRTAGAVRLRSRRHPPLPGRRDAEGGRRLQPVHQPALRGSSVSTSECNPEDEPPGGP